MAKAETLNVDEALEQWEEILALPPEKQLKTVIEYQQSRRKHPETYAAVVALAQEAKQRGYGRWSINGAFEILRWQTHETTGDLGLQVNNTYRAYAARDLMLEHPELRGFFEVRKLKPRPGNWGHIT
jgi:hypothetical protein